MPEDDSKTRTPILVTGGAGYIGSHTCKALHAAGYLPVVVDNLINGHAWAVKWGPLEVGDILDESFIREVVQNYRPAAAIHFAALAYVGESVLDPRSYYRNNVAGSLALFGALLDGGVNKVVFSSTCATYGNPDRLPIDERSAQAPINPYGASKLMIERILSDYGAAYGLESVALRYFNAAGADPDCEIGEFHDPETHLLPLVIQAALGERSEVKVFGSDYDTEDGTAVRDYVHVCDLADAHVRALEYLFAGGSSTAVNLGTGRGYSVNEVIRAVESASGNQVSLQRAPRRTGDPPSLVADASLARDLLDWSPSRSSLESITASALAWHIGVQDGRFP